MAVVNNDWWELFVYEIHHKQRAIDALDAQKMGRNITYIVYDATEERGCSVRTKYISDSLLWGKCSSF